MKPHLIVIMADQLRFDALGPHTPHLNQLREESSAFTRAYCTSPLCVPARGSFFSGLYPNQSGCLINPWEPTDRDHGFLSPGTPHLYALLEKEWDSWHTGKQHLKTKPLAEEDPASTTHWDTWEKGYPDFLKKHGQRAPGGPRFSGMVPEMANGRITRAKRYSVPTTGCYEPGFEFFYDGFIARGSVEALRRRDRAKPFALNAMFVAPHPPFDIPEPYYSAIKEVDLPENVGVWSPDQSPLQLYNLTGAAGVRYSREDWREIWKVYLGLVKLLDDCVGMIVEELKAQGIYDQSLIVFTSDHGEMLGSHCLWQKMCLYEESIRTPLWFKFPKGREMPASESEGLVSAIDLLPTLCDFLEIPLPHDDYPGRSLLPLLEGEPASAERDLFVQFDGNGSLGNFQRAVLQGNHKLIVDLFKDECFLELYDLERDPSELHNLVFEPEQKAQAEDLLERLRNHMRQTGDRLELPPNTLARFLSDYLPFHRRNT